MHARDFHLLQTKGIVLNRLTDPKKYDMLSEEFSDYQVSSIFNTLNGC